MIQTPTIDLFTRFVRGTAAALTECRFETCTTTAIELIRSQIAAVRDITGGADRMMMIRVLMMTCCLAVS